MKKKLTYYDGLYGDIDFKEKNNYIFLELIETRSKGFDWVIKPHFHAHLYQIFFIESGKVVLENSDQSLSLKTPCMLVIPPNTIHGLRYSKNVKGHILTISDTVFDNIFPNTPDLVIEFETLKYIILSSGLYEQMQLLFTEINEELFTKKINKELMLHALLCRLFISLHRLIVNHGNHLIKDTNQSLQYYRKFIQSVKAADKQKTIPAYANELNITAVHLNRICNEVRGKSALSIIQEHLIEQAKTYLLHTSYSVSEIAYLLNFEYPNYFARLFKKLNGVSPREFRNKQ